MAAKPIIRYFSYFFICLVWFGGDLFAQNEPDAGYVFEQITTKDGLPHNEVNSIVKDHAGFLWIATSEGLCRYDGTSFVTYKLNPNDSSTLLSNMVVTLAVDSKGILWCGTHDGVSAFDPVHGAFTNYHQYSHTTDPKKLASSPINKIFIDHEDNIWIASWEVLDMFDQKTKTFRHFYHDGKDSTTVRDNRTGLVYEDHLNRIWIGTFTGLDLYDRLSGVFQHIFIPSAQHNYTSGPLINDLFDDENGNLWISTWGDGLIRYTVDTKEIKIFLPEPDRGISGSRNITTCILKTQYRNEEKKLWISTKSSGLYLFDMISGSFTPMEETHSANKKFITNDINFLFDDGLGNIFAATGRGILKCSRSNQMFQKIRLKDADIAGCLSNIFTAYEDPEDKSGYTLWLGTWTCGAFKYNMATGRSEKVEEISKSHDPQTENNPINDFYRDHQGSLWAFTREAVFVMQKNSGQWLKIAQDNKDGQKLWDSPVESFIENDDGTFWFGCFQGLEHFDLGKGITKRLDIRAIAHSRNIGDIPGLSYVRSFCEYPKNIFWIVGPKGAILKYDLAKNDLKVFKNDLNDPSSMPLAFDLHQIIVDKRHQLWVSSVNGLMTFDPGAEKPIYKVYHTSDGLPSEIIYSLSEDTHGNIWMTTHHGVCSLEPLSGVIHSYGAGDGLLEMNSGYSIQLSAFGKMFITGIAELQYFDPVHISKDLYCGPVRLTSIKVLGKEYIFGKAPAHTDTISLSYKQNEVTVSFAMLDYAGSKKTAYDYYLEGFNEDWIPLGNIHQVTFTNLEGGTYKLHVRGYNADGVCGDSRTLLTIIVSPPFWKTAWFYTLCGLFIVASVFGYTRVRLHNLHKQKSKLEETVEHRTEQLRLEKENVERQKIRAEQSEKFKEQFLANMSHEIRTPMNAVMGMTNILLDKDPRPEQEAYLDRIRRSSEALLVIINDILDISKIEAGKMELEHIPFDLRETLGLIKQTLQFKAEEKGLILTLMIDDTIPNTLIGDPTRLQQILMNLAGNAIKFTESGEVTISCLSQENSGNDIRLRFEVSDTGIGMTQDQLSKIFESFTQASSDTTRKYGGTGLGLSISKQLVELQGGKIQVSSSPGEGSIFAFSIAYPITVNNAVVKKQHIVSQKMLDSLRGIRILLTDDNEYNRIVAKDTLELKIKDIFVIEAGDGREAVEKLREENFDLILMDVQMPILDGYSATQKIRTDFPYPKNTIPIIALTASVVRSDLEKCLQCGMNGYIPKPFRTEEFLHSIYSILHGEKMDLPDNDRTESAIFSAKVTDLSFLNEFTEGDEVQLQKYINMYLDSAPKNLQIIADSLSAKNFPVIKSTVHQIKPHLKFMGMGSAAEIAAKIEELAASGNDTAELTLLIKQLHEACRKSFEELAGKV